MFVLPSSSPFTQNSLIMFAYAIYDCYEVDNWKYMSCCFFKVSIFLKLSFLWAPKILFKTTLLIVNYQWLGLLSWNSSLCMGVGTSSRRQSTTLNSTTLLKTKFLVDAEVFVLIPFITTHLQGSPRWYHISSRYQKRICRDKTSNVLLFLCLTGFSEHHPIYLCFYHGIFKALSLVLATCTLPSGCTEKYKL